MGTQVPAQDYNKLRRSCIQKGKLFEDPYFPADERSLFFSQKLPFTPEWKRPHVSDHAWISLYRLSLSHCHTRGFSLCAYSW